MTNKVKHKVPCPLCGHRYGSDVWYAKEDDADSVECPDCGIAVRLVVPLFKVTEAGWHWMLTDDALKELLALWRSK